MSLPPLVPMTGTASEDWGRKVANLLNLVTNRTQGVGTTAQRPRNPVTGLVYFDTTLSKPVWWSGTRWNDANGSPA